MLVSLKRSVYFDKLYVANASGTEIPDEFCDKLPKDAKVMASPIPPEWVKPEPNTLSALAKAGRKAKDEPKVLSDLNED